MKWFPSLRALVYLKRISESLEVLSKIETERFIKENRNYRGWEALKPRKRIIDTDKTVIEKPSIQQLNTWWREDNEIKATAKDYEDSQL